MNKHSIMIKAVMIVLSTIGIADAKNNWTGLYVGADAGAVFNNIQLRSQQLGFTNVGDTCNANSNFSTFSPGIQLGYLHRFAHNFLAGIDANISFNTNQKDTVSCNSPFNSYVSDRISFKNEMQGFIKARGGYALNWNKNILLPYLTVGASFVNAKLTYQNEIGNYYSNNGNQAGWLIGTGIEWPFKQNWTLRAEYFYANYGNTINLAIPSIYGLIDSNGNARASLSSNSIAVSINYWI